MVSAPFEHLFELMYVQTLHIGFGQFCRIQEYFTGDKMVIKKSTAHEKTCFFSIRVYSEHGLKPVNGKEKCVDNTRPSQLIFIRHAESARNKAKKGSSYFADDEARKCLRGIPDADIPITDLGWDQARRTGRYLHERFGRPDYFYHSGYRRTMETLEGIFEDYSDMEKGLIQVRMNQFLRERDPGYTYDMTEKEAEVAFPWLKEHWVTYGGYFARPPGGESLADVAQRVHTFLNTIFRDRRGVKVWVVLHGGTLRAVRLLLERWDYQQALHWPDGQSPANCGITVYDFDRSAGRLVLQEYNTVCWR